MGYNLLMYGLINKEAAAQALRILAELVARKDGVFEGGSMDEDIKTFDSYRCSLRFKINPSDFEQVRREITS